MGCKAVRGPAAALFRRHDRTSQGPKLRNIAWDHAFPLHVAPQGLHCATIQGIEGIMATRRRDQIIETPTEARQGEPGPSVLALLTISTGLAMLVLGAVWFVFFRT
jgi:hypothetical protein